MVLREERKVEARQMTPEENVLAIANSIIKIVEERNELRRQVVYLSRRLADLEGKVRDDVDTDRP